ncbi:OsmC family peroxiredoxin [Comamonadaceae bacterium PP-2]
MSEKIATVAWLGAGKTGKGQISTETGVLKDQPYGFGTRFGDDRSGTNPEELLGAAHAACFTMAFAFAAEGAGFAVERANTQAKVRLAKDAEGFVIDRITLTFEAKVPGLDEAQFKTLADGAKRNCPLSKALASVPEIVLDAKLLD